MAHTSSAHASVCAISFINGFTKNCSVELKKVLGYVPIALLLLLVYLSFLVIHPFLSTIIGGLIIAYMCHPVYEWFLQKSGKRNMAAIIVILILIVVLTIPVIFVLNSIITEANNTYFETRSYLEQDVPFEDCENAVDNVRCMISGVASGSAVEYYVKESIRRVALFFTESAGHMIVALPSAIIDFFLMLFIVFFALRDGKLFFQKLNSIIPLNEEERTRIFESIKNMMSGVIYGSVVVAIIQGIMGGFGFFLFGLSSPVLWGIVMGLLAFIPLIGPLLIWLPAAMLLVLEGISSNENLMIAKGIGLIVYGVVFVSSIENILKPMIIGNKAKTHPLIILVGVLGGLKAFGLLGIVVGPLVLELLITFIAIVKEHWLRRKVSKTAHKV